MANLRFIRSNLDLLVLGILILYLAGTFAGSVLFLIGSGVSFGEVPTVAFWWDVTHLWLPFFFQN